MNLTYHSCPFKIKHYFITEHNLGWLMSLHLETNDFNQREFSNSVAWLVISSVTIFFLKLEIFR